MSDEYVKLNIEHAINELIGIVKYTEFFNDPEARDRQLKRNEEMRLKTIKRLCKLFDKKKPAETDSIYKDAPGWRTVYGVYWINHDRNKGGSTFYDTELEALNHLAGAPDDLEVWYTEQTYELEREHTGDCSEE